jgi:hypothetical protein
VRDYRLHRNRVADALVIGSFSLPYVWLAYRLISVISRRFQSDERVAAIVALALGSLAIAATAMLLGEIWSIWTEVARLGRGHLSYRTERIPWVQHRTAAFVLAWLTFWLVAGVRYLFRFTTRNPTESHSAIPI